MENSNRENSRQKKAWYNRKNTVAFMVIVTLLVIAALVAISLQTQKPKGNFVDFICHSYSGVETFVISVELNSKGSIDKEEVSKVATKVFEEALEKVANVDPQYELGSSSLTMFTFNDGIWIVKFNWVRALRVPPVVNDNWRYSYSSISVHGSFEVEINPSTRTIMFQITKTSGR